MVKRAASHLSDLTKLRAAFLDFEARTLHSALQTCVPQVETDCAQLECRETEAVIQSILTQIRNAKLESTGNEDLEDREEEGEEERCDLNFTLMREKVSKSRGNVEELKGNVKKTKENAQKLDSEVTSCAYKLIECRNTKEKSQKEQEEVSEMERICMEKWKDSTKTEAVFLEKSAQLDSQISNESGDLAKQTSKLPEILENPLLILQEKLNEIAKMQQEEKLHELIQFQARYSSAQQKLAQEIELFTRKKAENQVLSDSNTDLERLIKEGRRRMEEAEMRWTVVRKEDKGKQKVLKKRMKDLEGVKMETQDLKSSVRQMTRNWAKVREDLEKHRERCRQLATELNRRIVMCNSRLHADAKTPDRQWIEEECKSLEEEFQLRKSTVAREVQSTFTLKYEH